MQPLAGITVVSLEQAVAAPFATRQLADLGARVIKVERPGAGDFARAYDETVHGQSSYFVWLNRSKESLSLDVKADRGRARVARAVEVSLFDALAEWMSQPAYYTRYGGLQPPRLGTHHATIAPYGAYTAGDGREVLFSIQTEAEWRDLCTGFLGRPELVDDARFATSSARVTNRVALDEIIAAHYRRHPSGAIMATLDHLGIANSLINDVSEFLDHPVLAERGRWQPVETPGGPIEALLPPVTLAGVVPALGPVPAVGEHTDAILTDLGYDPADIASLRADTVI